MVPYQEPRKLHWYGGLMRIYLYISLIKLYGIIIGKYTYNPHVHAMGNKLFQLQGLLVYPQNGEWFAWPLMIEKSKIPPSIKRSRNNQSGHQNFENGFYKKNVFFEAGCLLRFEKILAFQNFKMHYNNILRVFWPDLKLDGSSFSRKTPHKNLHVLQVIKWQPAKQH